MTGCHPECIRASSRHIVKMMGHRCEGDGVSLRRIAKMMVHTGKMMGHHYEHVRASSRHIVNMMGFHPKGDDMSVCKEDRWASAQLTCIVMMTRHPHQHLLPSGHISFKRMGCYDEDMVSGQTISIAISGHP